MSQLDIFTDYSPPTATVIPFPLDRLMDSVWRPRVGPTARMLQDRKTEAGRVNGWNREIASLERKMVSRGARDDEIASALARFRQAVVVELERDRRSG